MNEGIHVENNQGPKMDDNDCEAYRENALAFHPLPMQIVSLQLFKYHFVFWLNFNKFVDKEAYVWTWKADCQCLQHIYVIYDSWEKMRKLKEKKDMIFSITL